MTETTTSTTHGRSLRRPIRTSVPRPEPARDGEEPTTGLDLAVAGTRPDRNRAVDFYRALAMLVVAVGHWVGTVVVTRPDGEVDGGNLLDFAPGYGWITWIGQVMPLFFFVGGFASAVSLTAAERKGTRPADWVATRLRRMLTPAAALAACWALVVAVGALFGGYGLMVLAAGGAAIPLWFLANYTIDTTIAPWTFRWFQEHPVLLIGGLATVFCVAETANTAGIPMVPQINWVIGWLGFQIAGFAWQRGKLPTGRTLVACAAVLWVAAIAATNLGPWPAVMLHHAGLEISPTHPPSTGLILFGFAYSLTAAALAPAVNRWLTRSERAWKLTIGANTIAMSVYLWHMTAAMVVIAVAYFGGFLPTVEAGTGAWWLTKIPFVIASTGVLVLIVRKVAPIEQRALLGPTARWPRGMGTLLPVAAVLSLAIKFWSSQDATMLTGGLVVTLVVWLAALRTPKRRR